MGSPKVSVILCAYNPGEYIGPAIDSVINQTYHDWEMVVVDDGSTDGSLDAAKAIYGDPRIRWFKQPNEGRPAALNRAIEQARGMYYLIQDADDISQPARIAKLVACLERHPDLAAIFSGHDIILDGVRMAPRFRDASREECRRVIDRFAIPAHDPTGMFRMSLAREYTYDINLPYTEAVDYILRIGEKYPLMVLGECLYSYRIHSASVTKRDPETRRKYVLECCKRACSRRGINFDCRFPHAKKPTRRTNREIDNNLAAHFIESACDLRRAGERKNAIKVGLQCARLHPLDSHYYKALLYATAPWWIVHKVRHLEA